MMGTDQHGLTPGLISELRRRGYSDNRIAEETGRSRQAVNQMAKRYGLPPANPRAAVKGMIPWNAGRRFNGSEFDRRMRDHAEYMATGGVGMSRDRLKRLRTFYDKLKALNAVVEFDPGIEPNEQSRFGGFAFRERVESDGELILRVNEHTESALDNDWLWEFPETLPGD